MTTIDYRELDWKLIGAALALSLIGVLTILSAQHYADSAFRQTYYLRQLLWLFIALLAFAAVIHLPYRLFDASAYTLYVVAVALLGLVLVAGSSRMGASRWFALGPLNFAPADLAKVALILAFARQAAYTKFPPASKKRLGITLVLTMIPAALILKQPDLGSALILIFVMVMIMFWSGLSPWYMLLLFSPVISLIAAFWWLSWILYFVALLTFLAILRPGLVTSVVMVVLNLLFGMITPMIWNKLKDYQKMRILVFLDPGHDPRGAGYQVIQSKIAIGSGGVIGKGYLQGSQARLDFLPERHTDFVFSVFAEEWGMIGSLVLLGLFGFLFYRCVRIAIGCRSKFSSFVAFGACMVLFFQFFVNIGMALGLMPVTGLQLPFVSYGGTGLVTAWVLIGLIVLSHYHRLDY